MSILEIRVGGRFRLKKSIGLGSFGEIYIAENVQTNEEVAVKLEDVKSKYPQLIYEAKIMYSLQGGSGIPNLIWCGQEGEYNILVMELLGESIEELFTLCRKKLSLKCVLMLVDQTLQVIEYMHNKGFIHRDIKPENILMGMGKKCHLAHFIDYGLAKRYREPKTGKHIPYREGKQLTGTARYASINTHHGYEQSRRDDLEALGYVYVYLFKGSLPWQGLKSESKQEKYNAIHQKKINTPLDELCTGMPREFITFFSYCRKLSFEEKPDYTYLRRMFKELALRNGFEFDYIFDWMLIPISTQVSLETSNKIAINLEVTPNDEFINYNFCNLDSKASPSLKIKTPHEVGTNHEQLDTQGQNMAADLGHGAAALVAKSKPKLKPIETEHLRTDYKLANLPSPANFKSPNNQGSAKKKAAASNGKDCNIF